jgi:hypothetical protein
MVSGRDANFVRTAAGQMEILTGGRCCPHLCKDGKAEILIFLCDPRSTGVFKRIGCGVLAIRFIRPQRHSGGGAGLRHTPAAHERWEQAERAMNYEADPELYGLRGSDVLVADFDRQLAAHMPSLAQAVRLGDLLKRKNPVKHGADLAGLDQGADLL